MNVIPMRLMAALRQPQCPPHVLGEAGARLLSRQSDLRAAAADVSWYESWLAFQQRETLSEYKGEFSLYAICDGETHYIAARSGTEAVEHYASMTGETVEEIRANSDEWDVQCLPPELGMGVFDEDGDKYEVKSHAEWAGVDAPEWICSTAY